MNCTEVRRRKIFLRLFRNDILYMTTILYKNEEEKKGVKQLMVILCVSRE